MDINKTVIMTDGVAGKDMRAVMNEVLACTCWGYMVAEDKWEIVSKGPTTIAPGDPPDDKLMTYMEFNERRHPQKDLRKYRTKLNCTFTHPGQPGASMAKYTEELVAVMTDRDGVPVFLIPSFLRLLVYLKCERRSFTICFRTFGDDLPMIASELNKFCEGKHPLWPGFRMDGSDGEPDYRFHLEDPEQIGTFFFEKDKLHLVLGTIEQPGEGMYKGVKDRSLSFYDGRSDVHKIIHGLEQTQEYINKKMRTCHTCGYRDHFAYWKESGYVADGGKLFFFDARRPTNQHEMFFDDNIRYTDAYIVRPINMRDTMRKPWATALLHSHLCRAEPLEAIKQHTYFVEQIQKMEQGYERKLQARERLLALIAKAQTYVRIKRFNLSDDGSKYLPTYDAWHSLRPTEAQLHCRCLDEAYKVAAEMEDGEEPSIS